jgi:hypothetical protein
MMARRGLFDVGFEDFGQPGGGKPQEVVFSGLGDLGATGMAFFKNSIRQAANSVSETKWAQMGGDMVPGSTDIARLSKLNDRLQDLGVRPSVMVAPTELHKGQGSLISDMHTFLGLVGIPSSGAVITRQMWGMLNQASYLRNSKQMPMLVGGAEPYRRKITRKPTDNALRNRDNVIKAGEEGNRLPVIGDGAGGKGKVTSPAKRNRLIKKALGRKKAIKAPPDSLAGKAQTKFRPGGGRRGVKGGKTMGEMKKLIVDAGKTKAKMAGLAGLVALVIIFFIGRSL